MGRATPFRQIIVVEPEKDHRDLVAALFEETGFGVIEYDDWLDALRHMEREGERVVLLFGDLDGDPASTVAAGRIAHRWPAARMVLTGSEGREPPPEARYMPKPWRALEVLIAAEHAAGLRN